MTAIEQERTTADLTAPPPIWATPAWSAAVARADGRCECVLSLPGHTHKIYDGKRCPIRQGLYGGRLHLLTDGRVVCAECAARNAKAAEAGPPPQSEDEQGSLF
jgi:hypothetical protein